jgi:Domain of unknown function (DUF5710)
MSVEPIRQQRVYLRVSFAQKDEAKGAGAFWDRNAKKWYVPPGRSRWNFLQWLPPEEKAAFEAENRRREDEKKRSQLWHSLEPRWTDPEVILSHIGQRPVRTTAFCVACDSHVDGWFLGGWPPSVELRHMAEVDGKIRPSEMRILEDALDKRLPDRKHDAYTNVSEVNSFVYCKRAWHLEQCGTASSLELERQAGIAMHRRYGRLVQASGRNERLALWLAIAALLLLLAAVLALR